MKGISNSKIVFGIILLLSITGSLSLVLFKFYYWQLIDQQSIFPEYGYWSYFIAIFILISVLSLTFSVLNKNKVIAYIPLAICIITLPIVLYAPYAVLYTDVYDALYEDNHEPVHEKFKLLEMLKKKDYSGLEKYFTSYHNISNNSPNRESVLIMAYNVFTINTKNDLQSNFDDWVLKTGSFQAYTARGYYLASQGWRVRGEKFMKDIAKKNKIQMRALFRKSASDLQSAIKINPYNSAAYMKLISVYGVLGNTPKAKQVLQSALGIYPYLYYARDMYMYYHLFPQWGGSHREMLDFSKNARRYAINNPRLIALTASAYEGIAGAEEKRDMTKAIQLYKKSLEYAPLNSVFLSLARIYKSRSDTDNELAQYNHVLRKSPFNARALGGRINILIQLQKIQDAVKDADVLLSINKEGWEASHAGWVYEHAQMYKKAVDAYKSSLTANPEFEYSYERLIALNISPFNDVKSALNIAIAMEKALPDNPKGWLYTADYMYDLNMDDAIYHINHYFELIDKNTNKDNEAYKAATKLQKDIKLRIDTHSIN